jgi:DtxR family Mn-dependent transcriptional regulator
MSHAASDPSQLRPTHTVEDYLMTMQVMERDHGEIIAARLAEMLDVAPATVAMTLKRMQRDNWITGTGRKAVHLTEAGREAANDITRRHMLAEWLLVKVLKVPLSETHNEAHNIEHAISPQLEERLRDVLGDPKVCPHGNPFPGCEETTSRWVPLTSQPAGETLTLRRIHEFAEEHLDLLKFLVSNGVVPGAQLRVTEVLPFNQTMTISVEDKPVTLGFSAACFLFVEKLENK